MNKARRKILEKAQGLIEEARALIADAASGERDYYDNMPESLQNGERGEQADTAASALEEADGNIDEILEKIEEALT